MPLITTEAIILQTHAYSETSKILRLLTQTHGVRSAIARGALRPKSRYGGVLEPFTVGMATLYLKDGRELQTMSGFELVRSSQALGQDLLRFGAASLLAEVVLRTASETPDPALYEHVQRSLLRLERAAPDSVESTALAETWALTDRLGFGPQLDECLACGRTLGEEEDSSFDHGAGGVRCAECAEGAPGRRLPPHARLALVRLVRGEPVPLERTAAHWQLLARFLTYHLTDGGVLRSLTFLSEALEVG